MTPLYMERYWTAVFTTAKTR